MYLSRLKTNSRLNEVPLRDNLGNRLTDITDLLLLVLRLGSKNHLSAVQVTNYCKCSAGSEKDRAECGRGESVVAQRPLDVGALKVLLPLERRRPSVSSTFVQAAGGITRSRSELRWATHLLGASAGYGRPCGTADKATNAAVLLHTPCACTALGSRRVLGGTCA